MDSLITGPLPTDGSDDTERYRVRCQDHPEPRARLDRIVGSKEHAANLEAKHLREYHAGADWPALNLSAVATLVLMAATIDQTHSALTPGWSANQAEATAVLGMWESLTGLPRAEAIDLAQRVQASREPVTAHVAPF